jgi:hypothetical protein
MLAVDYISSLANEWIAKGKNVGLTVEHKKRRICFT